jgi:MFS family permease
MIFTWNEGLREEYRSATSLRLEGIRVMTNLLSSAFLYGTLRELEEGRSIAKALLLSCGIFLERKRKFEPMEKSAGRGPVIHYGWFVMAMGMLTTIGAHGFGRMAYTLILPSMKDGLHFSYAQLGLLGTGNFLGYLSLAIVGGFWAAKFGARIVITLALVLMGITMIMTGLAQSFRFAFAMRLLTGFGNGAAYVPAMALGSAWFAAKRRGLATGIVSAGIGVGTLIAGILVPYILQSYGPEGWRFCWYYLGGAVIMICGFVGVFIRSRPEEKGLSPIGSEEGIAALRPGREETGVTALQWEWIYRVKGMWVLGLVYFMYGCSYIIYMTFFAAYLIKEMGLSHSQAGGLWALVGGLSIFCGIIWGGVSDLLGRRYGSALAYLALAFAYALLALIKSSPGFYCSAVIFGLSAWSLPTIMAAAAGDYVGARLAPAGLGFITLFFGIGQALGPALGGYLADATHSFVAPFLFAAAVSFLGAFLSLYLKKPQRDEMIL